MKQIAILSLAFLMLLSACSDAQRKSDNQNSTTMYKNLSANEFEKGMTASNAVIIDVRTPMEYNEGHIKNAKLIDIYGRDFASEIEKLDRNKAYYVYCRSGNRSSSAAGFMVSKGFTKVYNLNGGIGAWINNGKPLER
ncbi:rhodanese-like domain-containing protein [Raineya orbicola]|jgi:rhodanese-related sulfurtransferase|uniref:Rhodanese-related sulfurtransferase n=1 Tax=Raineya orbicola TaxID=2016530 RepID=A0A2N3IAE4_9BACT|nr:rhodanese-like domain-containing protein [Raineya orbicola]PKQ67203.1 Rhodanese-related sulfurtransferase [Raineya orbicola]